MPGDGREDSRLTAATVFLGLMAGPIATGAHGVELSLSAMTALVLLQSEGYALIPWGAQ